MARLLDKGISKLYHTISEVCDLVGEEAHVLRYWESEFPQLRPKKNKAGKRTYTRNDIDTLFRIRQLLREEKYTLEGARQAMKQKPEAGALAVAPDLASVRSLLVDVRDRIR